MCEKQAEGRGLDPEKVAEGLLHEARRSTLAESAQLRREAAATFVLKLQTVAHELLRLCDRLRNEKSATAEASADWLLAKIECEFEADFGHALFVSKQAAGSTVTRCPQCKRIEFHGAHDPPTRCDCGAKLNTTRASHLALEFRDNA